MFGKELAKNTETIICKDLENEDEVAKAVEGCEIFVGSIAANEYTVTKVDPIVHVKTQLPYTVTALIISAVLYLILGFIL